MDELVKPNWHIAMVHFPIALIFLGAAIELLSFLGWRRTTLRTAGRWMLLAGAIFAVPVTFSGIYALADVAPQGIDAIRQINPVLGQELFNHMWMQSAATALAMLIVAVWIGLSDGWRDRLSILFKVALLGLVGLMIYASHIGGQQVYEHQLATTQISEPTSMPSASALGEVDTWARLFPPDQTHVVIAGFAMAAACVCIGLSARATHFETLTDPAEAQLAAAFAPARSASMGIVGDPYVPYVSPINHTPPVRNGRLWMVALAIVILASLSGVAIIALDERTLDFTALWIAISKPINDGDPQITRRLAHGIIGTVIVVDSLILTILSRFGRRRATVLAMFALPLILAVAAQIWLGILLLLDGPGGPITRFMH